MPDAADLAPPPRRPRAARPGGDRPAIPVRAAAVALLLAAVLACAGGPAQAEEADARTLARELAHLIHAGPSGRLLEDQVGASLMQAVAVTLQQRLDRRLLEVELRMLTRIVREFVDQALPPGRTEEIAADVYLRHFDAAELKALLDFQRSPLGRKAARLAPLVAAEMARAIDREVRSSPALPGMLEELRRAFPVLGPSESP